MLLADRGYDADWIRALAVERGAWANIPPKCNRNSPVCFSPYLYRNRNLIERFFNKIKQCRLAHHGATCPMPSVRTPPATTASFAGDGQASGAASWTRWPLPMMRRCR